jgi:hypothetical protein
MPDQRVYFCEKVRVLHLPKLRYRILEPAHNLELKAGLISVQQVELFQETYRGTSTCIEA